MNIRAWFQKAAAKIAALFRVHVEFFREGKLLAFQTIAFDVFGWLAYINPLCLSALMIAWNPWISLATLIAVSVFFNLSAKIAALGIAKIFFDEEDPQKVQEKMGKVITATYLYRNIEWLQVALTILVVSVLKYYGCGEISIFLILWIWCVVNTAPVIFVGDRKNVDITTMEGRRRLFNALYEISNYPIRIILAIIEIGYGVRLVFWDGPEWFFLFFRKPKDRWTRWKEVIFYVTATGLQMAVWTKIYYFGYENVSKIVKNFWK